MYRVIGIDNLTVVPVLRLTGWCIAAPGIAAKLNTISFSHCSCVHCSCVHCSCSEAQKSNGSEMHSVRRLLVLVLMISKGEAIKLKAARSDMEVNCAEMDCPRESIIY